MEAQVGDVGWSPDYKAGRLPFPTEAMTVGTTENPPLSGPLLKERGQAKVDAAEAQEWKDDADDALIRLARTGAEFTAEDVRLLAGDPAHPNAMGARLSAAVKAKLIRRVGYRLAERPERHGAMISTWVGR